VGGNVTRVIILIVEQLFTVFSSRCFSLELLLFFDKSRSGGWVRGLQLPVLNLKRTGY
jgi:hypothetical protein